jgi:hypothetical protein
MKAKDNNPETDSGTGWEEDLATIRSALSGMESVEPPDLLDQAVLNKARRELAASKRKPIRWVGAFATAAVVVLAMTIVIQQEQKSPVQVKGNGIKLDADKPVSAAEKSTVGASASSKPRTISPQAASVLSSEAPAKSEQQQLERKRQKASAINTPAASALEAEYDADNSDDRTPIQEQSSEESGYRAVIEPGRAESHADFEAERSNLQSEPARAPAMRAEAVEMEQANDAPSDFFQNDSIAPKMLDKAGKEDLNETALVEEGLAGEDQLTPQAWIEHLLELYEAGKNEELKAELAAFRTAYPEHPLPAELQN